MTPDVNLDPIRDSISQFWKSFEDKAILEKAWEASIRYADEILLQARQVLAEKSIATVPPRALYSYLTRDLDNWQDNDVSHQHVHLQEVVVAPKTTFYLGVRLDLAKTFIYRNGVELDPLDDVFALSNDPDAAQLLGTEAEGTRLTFVSNVLAGEVIEVLSDSLMLSRRITFDGTQTEVDLGSAVEPLSLAVTIESYDITAQVEVTASSVRYRKPTSGARPQFLAGSVLRVVDTTSAATFDIPVVAAADSVGFPAMVTPATTGIHLVVNLAVSRGLVQQEADRVRLLDKALPPRITLGIEDDGGRFTYTPTAPVNHVVIPRAFADTARITVLGGQVQDGAITVDADGVVTLEAAFLSGAVVRFDARSRTDHTHVHQTLTLDTPTATASLPDVTAPFALSGGAEDSRYPLLVYVNGVLSPGGVDWSLVSATAVEFMGVLPAGTRIDFHYAYGTARAHRHRTTRTQVTIPGTVVTALPYAHEPEMPMRIALNGITIEDAFTHNLAQDIWTSAFALPAGDVALFHAIETDYAYYHELEAEDAPFVEARYLQDGIDAQDDLHPGGYTTQLAWETGFTIRDGVVYADAVVTPGWFEQAQVDLEVGYENFGRLVQFHRETATQQEAIDYLNRVQALFSAMWSGSTRDTLENAASVILGSGIVTAAGEITGFSHDADGTRALSFAGAGGGLTTIPLHPTIPDRVAAGAVAAFTAVSQYAREHDISELPVPMLAKTVEAFSDTFRLGHSLDRVRINEITGGPLPVRLAARPDDPTFEESLIEDQTKNFIDEGVFANDLIVVVPASDTSLRIFARIREVVDAHTLRLSWLPSPVLLGFGEGGFGEGGFGGYTAVSETITYTVWGRRRPRYDTALWTDELAAEQHEQIQDALVPLFSAFMCALYVRWEAMGDAQAQTDLATFIERFRPANAQATVYTRFNNERGMQEQVQADLAEELTLTAAPAYAIVGVSYVAPGATTTDPVSGGFVSP